MKVCSFVELLASDVPVTNSYDNEPAGYGSVCSTNSECQQNTNHLRCLRGTCVCLEGYVPLGKYLCYHIRAPSNEFREIYIIIEIYFQAHRLYKVQLWYQRPLVEQQRQQFQQLKMML